MADNKRFGDKVEAFFAGKGFYIVLFLCVAVIGVSAYFLLTGNGDDVEDDYGTGSVLQEDVPPIDEDPELIYPPEVLAEPYEEPGEGDALLEEVTESTETGALGGGEAAVLTSPQYVWPLEGQIDMPYSVTALIYNRKLGDWRTNDTVTISAPLGTQVQAAGSGQVERVYTDAMGGMTVVISHSGGLKSVYSNLAGMPTVYEGDNVMTGEVIGAVGVTAPGETKEEPHLGFKMTLDGQSVNPTDYLPPR